MNLPTVLQTKKRLLLAAFLSAAVCFAENTHLFLEPLFGVRYGTLNEYVFSDYNTSSNRKLSQLDWEAKPLFYAGGKASVSYKLFDFAFYGGGFFPGRSGTMYDSDWLSDFDATMKTNYSVSDNILNAGTFCGTSFSASFSPLSFLEIAPSVSIDYERYSFTAKDGYGYYGDKKNSKTGTAVSWDDENAQFYQKGELCSIDYTRNTFYTWLGFLVQYKLLKFLKINAGIYTAPFMLIESLDHHLAFKGNGTFYNDVMYGFFKGWKFNSEVIWNINSRFSLKAAATFTRINCIKGTTYSSSSENGPYSESKKSDSEPGAGADFWNWSLSIEYRLF